MIRAVAAGIAVLYLIAAAVTFLLHLSFLLVGYLTLNGLLILIALVIERGRYRAPTHSGDWEPTGERFVDPGNGHLIEVRYNRNSGTRRYDDLGRHTPDER